MQSKTGRKLRVLNVCETARGGVGIYQKHIALLERHGFEMHHLVPAQDADFLGDGLRLHSFDRRRRGPRAVAAMLRRFRGLLDEVDPDICFFHSTFALAALTALRLRGDRRPALYCPHGWAVSGYRDSALKSVVVRQVEGRLGGLADRVVCVSQNERETAEALGYRGDFTVVENAAPEPSPDAADDLFAAEPEAIHLLFVGRMDRQKGFDVLAEAIQAAGRSDLRLHVVGGAVRGQAGAVSLPEGAEMAGWVGPDEIDSWYRSADALIVPSRWEGLPLVIPEALRNATPVLCSQRSGMAGLITPGETGEHFPLDPAALADLLRGLNKDTLRAMRPACRATYAERYSVDRMLGEIEALLREVAG